MNEENTKNKLMKRYNNLMALSTGLLAFAITLYFLNILVTSVFVEDRVVECNAECATLIRGHINFSLLVFCMIYVCWILVFFMDKTIREVVKDERMG